ncbi:MAG: helix-turn-helix transcriptional regulator, partial [Treponema sp.]|nr:helix-turn-helix transcriptional regulator [Treponema sp.]
MEWIKVINDAIDFMEKNLTEKIGLLEVARSVNISAFHFHHAFTIMTGITPAEYIRNRRLTLAGLELADGSSKIIDIALKYGYETPESFTKAFSRFHGFSPMQVRKGSPLKSMNRYTVRITIDGGTIMEYKIEKWDELDLLVHAKDFHAETSDN